MAINYPTSLDTSTTLPNPASTDTVANVNHAGLHDNENAAIIATQTKVGIGASTPVVSTLLFGTGTGTSAWTQLTSAQLAASLTDETGTGANVFATTPTLVTPKVDTINESTTNNGTTIGGVNIKAGALNTNNSVVTTNITDNNVTASKLATNAITLGYSKITANFTGTQTTTYALITGLAATVTVPSGGRNVKITFSGSCSASAVAGNQFSLDIFDSTSSTELGVMTASIPTASYTVNSTFVAYIPAPSAGSHAYQIRYTQTSAGTFTCYATATGPASILVEAI